MEKETVIPEEILSFFSDEGGRSLLVKGNTGTGKTTLALELMRRDYGIEKTEFISKRMGEKSLFRQYPWLKEKLKKEDIVENARKLLNSFYSDEVVDSVSMDEVKKTQTFLSRRFLDSVYEDDEDIQEVEREELKKLEGKVERGEIITEEDELDDKLKNEFVFEIGKTLPELDKSYDMVNRNLPDKSLIIIDSIESLSEHYGIPKEKIVKTLQKDLVEKSNTNVIFTYENLGSSELDHVVDGIVELKEEKREDRTLRMMEIMKLRTQEIDNRKYLYTLSEGEFQAISKTSTLYGERPGLAEYDFSALDEELTKIINDIEPGQLSLLEVDRNSPREYIDTLLCFLIADSCESGRASIWLPSLETRPDYLITTVESQLGTENKDLEDFLLLETEKDISTEKVKLLSGNDINQDLNKELIEHSIPQSSDHLTILLDLETIELVYGPEAFNDLRRIITSFKKRGHSVVLIGGDYLENLKRFEYMAESVTKIEEIEDTTCIFGKKPQTSIYSVSSNLEDGFKLDLVPIK